MPPNARLNGPTAILLLLTFAGCLGTGAAPVPGASDPGSPATTHCTGNETTPALELAGEVPTSAHGFELTASPATVERGAPISFELTNVADERQSTGTRHRYALQRQVDGGWQTVTRFPARRSGFNATAVFHDPGSGFEWTFPASAAGFSDGKFVVCERLPAGEYRFAFAGPDPLAVEFELTDG